MDIKFGEQIILSYRRLSYTAWYALAEFVDNSTEAYFGNQEILDSVFEKEGVKLTVRVDYDSTNDLLEIVDNSIGMNREELQWALTIGKPPLKPAGRSKYGLGMKTAACWLGNKWVIKTKKLNETNEYSATIDVNEIAKGNRDVNLQENYKPEKEHYTKIFISDLNRNLGGRTKGKIKDFLRSIYRLDFEDYGLKIFLGDELLKWNREKMINNKLHVNKDGSLKKKDFEFTIGKDDKIKTITGWVGVLESGSRRDAGFSIIQSKRVIKGWPDSYRPETIYGEGRNDLVNQRLVGELFLDDFDVSHTRDEILFIDNEQEELESKLLEEFQDYKKFAQDYRKYLDDERFVSDNDAINALESFSSELDSTLLHDKIFVDTIPGENLLKKIKRNLIEAVTGRMDASLKAKIDNLQILIYLDSDLSANDPYILIESTDNESRVIIIINKSHPHWTYLKDSDSILNFVRHCTYDGVAEWKAYFKAGRIDPDTVKYIKDGLLRVPLEIENNGK